MATHTVQLFAAAREAVGRPETEVELPAGATVSDLMTTLTIVHPELEPILRTSRIAIDCVYAAPDAGIPQNGELAVIPPVSGG